MMKLWTAILPFLFLTASCAQRATQSNLEATTTPMTTGSPLTPKATPVVAAVSSSTPTLPAIKKDPRSSIKDDTLHPRGIDFGATLKTIAFSSSANQDLPQPLWKTIGENKPDLFIFMGDNIQTNKPDQRMVIDQYRKLDRNTDYRSFREKVPFLATWNDQDEGPEFTRYWNYVRDAVAMGQSGIYHSKIIGPKKKMVQIIMLDTRSFRSKPGSGKQNLLGETQWDWLEAQLKRPAQVRFLVTSIPLIGTEHGTDKWSNFPQERQRLFDLLKKTRAANTIVFSGDRRQASVAKTGLKDYGPLYDITASPLNDAPTAGAPVEGDASYEGKPFVGENFGLAHIDWNAHHVNLEVRDLNNKVVNAVNVKIR